ncbi:MAG TPA: formate dehydrogenase subunit gamma, partial [Ramlibacter sp.]|nr:formate dehydrogenase subunit gamma [Ramlibacter sp.]
MPRLLELAVAAALTLGALGLAGAQTTPAAPAGGSSTSSAPAPQKSGADDPAPPGTAPTGGGIQGQNIFDVKPEVKRDASSDPDYLKQNNAQRNAVQPGNNAPMWRGVERGMEGYSSLPKSQAPEAGV